MQLTRLNFVTTATSLSKLNMAILALGLIAVFASGIRWAFQLESTANLEKQIQRSRPKSTVVPAKSAAEKHQSEAQIKAVGEAVRQLNLPIAELIKTLQPPKDINVSLLGLDVGGKAVSGEKTDSNATGILKITAEAKTPQAMTMYVALLAERPMFKTVYLIKHEIYTATPEMPYRFMLEAQWKE